MKFYRLFTFVLVGAVLASCDIKNIAPESGTILTSQLQSTTAAEPSRAEASFMGLFTHIGTPIKISSRADDWGLLMNLFSTDVEGADICIPDSGYNWFSVCGELTSRTPTYANPYQRYIIPYNIIGGVNDFLASFPDEVTDPRSINMIAQARALRAYAYYILVQDFQFVTNKEGLAVPIVDKTTPDVTHNPRATVQEVFEKVIFPDLNFAVENLTEERLISGNAQDINVNVAYGLRARANLAYGNFKEAAEDAAAAAEGFTPASIAEVSVPSFMDISEHNWIWGFDNTEDIALKYRYATPSSWLRSFSAWGYAPACQVYSCINILLYAKIPDTDVRKGWWVDENLESPLLKGLKWPGFDDVANADDGGDSKTPYLPYTNVKFGCYTVGTTKNDEDFPLMRVEEMILIQAEGLAKSGNEGDAKKILEDFVSTYRQPGYTCDQSGLSLQDEIWKQRRIELWGEGFGAYDIKRLGKPLVRFHDAATTNFATLHAFNMTADDGWHLLRFSQYETNANYSIVNNTEGSLPKAGQNPDLRDGVTD
ncbi:MAG: RagB/SusD family nutrient uptake outer membrane protein [Bacteroidales bacterium]|nr:RagB/SusD family nutrient uptake outer membrane protein [Bacteroidales bacterium]